MNDQTQNTRQPRSLQSDASVQIEVPPNHHIVTRVSYGTPSRFHSCCGIWPIDRKWWQFWLPKMLSLYCTVEPKAASRPEAADSVIGGNEKV